MIEPLANVLIAQEPDPARAAALCAALRQGGEFDEVFPQAGCVVAVKTLPDTAADDGTWRGQGVIFAEGGDVAGPACAEARRRELDAAELAKWPGDFTFFQLDGAAITAVRSVAGRVPVYFWQAEGRWVLSTRFEHAYLPAVRPARLDPDLLCCAMALLEDHAFPGTRTPLRQVGQVPRAQFLRFSPGRAPAGGAYWQPPQVEPRVPSPDEERETIERFRDLLMDALRRGTHPSRPNLLAFSGGVDSSALAYLMRGLGRRLWTLTMVAEERAARQHQLSYVNPVLRDCAVERARFVTWDEDDFVASLGRPRHGRYPALEGILRAVADPAWPEAPSTFVGGDLGDEVCGSVRTYPDWSLCVRPGDLWRLRGRWPDGPRAALRWAKHRVLARLGRPLVPRARALPEFFSRELRDEYRDEYAATVARWRAAAPRRPYLLGATELFSAGAAASWELASARGVRIVLPFVSRGLMELALACHPCIQVGPELRRLLRLAFRGEIGARSLYRSDKGVTPYVYEPRRYTAPAGGWSPSTLEALPAGAPPDLSGATLRDAQLLLLFDHLTRGLRAAAFALPARGH